MKSVKFVVTVLALVAVMVIAGISTTQAQTNDSLPAPANLTAVNGPNPGEVNLTWDAVQGASFYRIGWIADADYRQTLADGTDFLERFAFVDVTDRTAYTITRLTPGEDYWFIVASNRQRYGTPSWPENWAQLTLNADDAPCPTAEAEPEPGTTPRPTPTPAPTATPTPTPVPAGAQSFSNGFVAVGASGIEPGTYISTNQEYVCNWARKSGFSDSYDDTIASGYARRGTDAIVTILSTDAAFFSSSCKQWQRMGSVVVQSFSNGFVAVGASGIEPGTYISTNQEYVCNWARKSGFSDSYDDTIASGYARRGTDATVAILSTDAAFFSSSCKQWQRMGSVAGE